MDIYIYNFGTASSGLFDCPCVLSSQRSIYVRPLRGLSGPKPLRLQRLRHNQTRTPMFSVVACLRSYRIYYTTQTRKKTNKQQKQKNARGGGG